MQPDPILYIAAALFIGGILGFIACSIMCSKRLRRADIDAWREARDFYQNLYSSKNN